MILPIFNLNIINQGNFVCPNGGLKEGGIFPRYHVCVYGPKVSIKVKKYIHDKQVTTSIKSW